MSYARSIIKFSTGLYRCNKCSYLLNSNWTTQTLFAIIKPLLPADKLKKIKILGDDWKESLKEIIDDDNLPNEYGGSAPNYC